MTSAQPRASAVAVAQGRILAIGSDDEIELLCGPQTEVIGCGGRTLLPAFIDPHVHLLAYAANFLAVDCSPGVVASIAEIQQAVRRRASSEEPGRWIRAYGYSESDLAEGRHPTRWDLDAVAPVNPVRLIHRSGHACVLNTMALRACGIAITTEEPAGGYMERELSSGEPSGLLIEMNEVVERAAPPLSYEELAQRMALASEEMLSRGITAIQDMSGSNTSGDLLLLHRLHEDGYLRQRQGAAIGYDAMDDAEGRNGGTVKIMIKEVGGDIYPGAEALTEMVMRAHDRGFQVAVHAVEEMAVAAAAQAFRRALDRNPRGGLRHRIEHCGLCSPAQAQELGELGLVVVTQPSFIHYNGDRYLRQVPPSAQGFLYPLRTLLSSGVHLAAGSDCPVVAPNPLMGIYGAAVRRSITGETVAGGESIDAAAALSMHTRGAAYACFSEGERGALVPGLAADLVLLSGDPTRGDLERIAGLSVEMTVLGGRVAYARGGCLRRDLNG